MMNKDTPHFSPQELRAIYAAAAEKTKDGMSAAARALYPAREDALKTLYWLPGGGRAFRCSVFFHQEACLYDGQLLGKTGFYTAVLAR